MLDVFLSSTRKLAEAWKAEAARRRAISEQDAVADTMVYLSTELLGHLTELDRGSYYVNVEQYAQLQTPKVSAQTVRNWIRRGELEAEETAHGYMIRRTAVRTRRLLRA